MPDKITIEVSEEFLNWWNTTPMGNDRQEKMVLAWWGWSACHKLYSPWPLKMKSTAKETREMLRKRELFNEEDKEDKENSEA